MTARDLISASLRKIGALASGETLAASDASDALADLNRMLSSWSTERLLVNAIVREVFPLVIGQQAYTMGVGGNFNSSRPQRVEIALLQVTSSSPVVELPMEILNVDQWSAIVIKGVQSTIPTYLYPEGTNPLETLNIWPIPLVANNLVLYTWKAFTQFTDLTTAITFPPGYEDALVYNFAVRIAPEYGRSLGPEVVQIAMESKAAIKRMNSRPQYLEVDSALRGNAHTFNWITGESK